MMISVLSQFFRGLLLGGVLAAGGCALFSKGVSDQVSLETLSFQSSLDVNQNTAVSVDLVMAYNAPLYELLKGMTAEVYFSRAEQLRRDNYGVIQIWHWEIVPGQLAGFQLVAPTCNAIGAMLFIDYKTPGEHRADVGKMQHVFLYLDKQGFRLNPTRPPNIPWVEALPAPLETPLIQHPAPPALAPASPPPSDGK